MDSRQSYTLVVAPREGVNDDTVRVVEWLVRDGERAEAGTPFMTLETAKATIHLDAPRGGFVFHLVPAGAEVRVGTPVAAVAERPERPTLPADGDHAAAPAPSGEQIISKKARLLMEEHGLSPTQFTGLAVVRTSDVEALLQQQPQVSGPALQTVRGEKVDADWDAVCDTELHRELSKLLTALRKRMKARFDRHVSTGNLLHDRWELAKDFGFGEGTSVYDDCLILGEVRVGRHCWVGPQTILDGQGTLTIGDYVDVGAGTHLYTHNTIERALTGHRAPMFKKATTIGSCCFIAPGVVVAPGTVLGDHCFVAAGSYVEGNFPAFSFIAGNPATRVGVVELRNDRARLRHFGDKPHNTAPSGEE
jgi:acetyltransferase-like isoleucine patch superfamily enzyme